MNDDSKIATYAWLKTSFVHDTLDIRQTSPFIWILESTLTGSTLFSPGYLFQDGRMSMMFYDVINDIRIRITEAIANRFRIHTLR